MFLSWVSSFLCCCSRGVSSLDLYIRRITGFNCKKKNCYHHEYIIIIFKPWHYFMFVCFYSRFYFGSKNATDLANNFCYCFFHLLVFNIILRHRVFQTVKFNSYLYHLYSEITSLWKIDFFFFCWVGLSKWRVVFCHSLEFYFDKIATLIAIIK